MLKLALKPTRQANHSSSPLSGCHSVNTVPLLHAMIASPSRLPEPATKLGVSNALSARIVSREVSATAVHCIERAVSLVLLVSRARSKSRNRSRSRSIHAAG